MPSLLAQTAPSDSIENTVTDTYTTHCHDAFGYPYKGTIPVSVTWTAVPMDDTDSASQYQVTVAITNIQSSPCMNWVITLQQPGIDQVISIDSTVDHGIYGDLGTSLFYLQSAGNRIIQPGSTFSFTYIVTPHNAEPTPPDWLNFTWQPSSSSTADDGLTIFSDYYLGSVHTSTETR